MDIGKQQRVIRVEPIEAPAPETTEPEPQREIAEPEPTRPARQHRPTARPTAHQDG
jgi:hypothetical protein